jgi:hypothetical protein
MVDIPCHPLNLWQGTVAEPGDIGLKVTASVRIRAAYGFSMPV